MERKLHLAQVIFSLFILLSSFGCRTATPLWHAKNRLAPMVDRSRRSDDKSDSSSDRARSTCADPGIPADATRVGKSFHVGSKLFFSCRPGFVLRGSEVLTCRYGDENVPYWDADLPQCVGKRQAVMPCVYLLYYYYIHVIAAIWVILFEWYISMLWFLTADLIVYYFI